MYFILTKKCYRPLQIHHSLIRTMKQKRSLQTQSNTHLRTPEEPQRPLFAKKHFAKIICC